MEIVGVLLKSSKLLGLIDAKLGDDCDAQAGDWQTAAMRADVLLVDGVADDAVMAVAQRANARLILSTAQKRSRLTVARWTQVGRERISHQFVAGGHREHD
jgi:hypothetical protein